MNQSDQNNLHVVAIIQGRMSSSRLPGKILMDLDGQPMLAHVVERVRMAKTIHEVIVATTTDPTDDAAAEYCCGSTVSPVNAAACMTCSTVSTRQPKLTRQM